MNESCGCCEGLEPLTPLTTANRPGLDALAYRAGTHATFLETMKARLSAAEYPALSVLTTRAETDPSIALLDAWATVADVLTFYQERIANEGYLRTATERRSILELARLVGYVPRPGVAASVYLAFTLEDGYEVEIPAGTRAQSLPGPGELPQFFETSEQLAARADWNILKPRLTRPQSLQPSTPQNGDSPPRRLYLKGIATNLEPNDPLLIDFGETQEFFKAHTVEPDPEADRTLVTLAPVVSPTDSVTGVRTEDIVRRVDRYLDLEAYEVSRVSQTAGRVVGLLEEWRDDELTRETPPEELADSLRGRVLPQLQQDLDNARRYGHARLRPWIEQIVEELQEIEEELSAAASRGLARIPSAPDGNGRPPAATLEELLDRLGEPPSVPPVNAAKLSRRLETSFGANSDAIPQLLTALRPDLGRALYQAWEQTGAEPSAVRVYALRTTASPFGHNAPPKAIIKANDTTTVDYEEWTLERATPGVEESYRISVGVDRQVYSDPDDLPELRIDLSVGTEAGQSDEHAQTLALQPNELVLELEATDQRVRVNIDVEDVADGKRYTVVWDFLDRQTVVTISDRVFLIQIGIAAPNISGDMSGRRPEGGETVSAETTPPSAVQINVEASYPDGGKQITASGQMRRRSTEPTEKENVVSLDASYKQILPESWVVLERPNPVGTIPQTVITRGAEVREASRADYGITAKSTQITLRQRWLDLNLDGFTVIRGTSVHAGSELLEVAEAPPEVVDDGVVKLEPVCGGQIELDALYDGLEPGRWLFVTGERDDLPGVRASELVMLAGVEQGVQQVRLTTGDLQRIVGELPTLRLAGKGSTGPGGLDLTISARRAADGSVSGYAHRVGGATGEVVGIVPPADDRGFWCINVRLTDTGTNSGDQRINWYVRDTGDGRTSFDEISYVTSIGGDCERFPAPTGSWLRLVEGDFQVTAEEPTGDRVHSTIILANDLAYCYKRETVRIYGNVVNATHGETRPEMLGSGDGSAAFQRFTLKQSPLTYVAATTPSGVESTLKVYVNDIRWHEAEHLAGLQPTDRRFLTQTDDQGEVTIVFGDGLRGARLPTGVENVRAVYRTGIGQAGNVAAEQISLLATRPLGLKGVINPLPASGGADRETRDQARSNAPLGVKVLDRLVSVRDHEDFARAFAGIGKASATRLSDGRQQLVHLTIAGADDIPIAESSDLYRHLLQALHRFGDPQQPIRVEVRELILLIISAGVRLMPDYLWESVEPQIRASVLETFSFERRDLGRDALLSEAISTIQHVPGVSYVDVDTFGGIPEKTVDAESGLRRALFPNEIEVEIRKLVRSEDQPLQRVTVNLAGSEGLSIHPAQLAFLTPKVPDTLILKEITA
jgi:Baseplate J-like protein